MAGKRWNLPTEARAAKVRLQYQTSCRMEHRAGRAQLAMLSRGYWDRLATSPEAAAACELVVDEKDVLAVFPIHDGQEDVLAWTPWVSPDLASPLRRVADAEAVVAIVWSGAHFNHEEWAKFAEIEMLAFTAEQLNRETLESLDLDRPELQTIREALSQDDLAAAKEAMVDHMRTRKRPVGPPMSPADQRIVSAADRIVDHVFQLRRRRPGSTRPTHPVE